MLNLNYIFFHFRTQRCLYLYLIIFGFCLEGTSQKIYGFMDRYFVSIDLENKTCDSLIAFSKRPFINLNFFAAIDRYNGRYFFSGGLPDRIGNFHIIDLQTLEIQSANFYTGEMEYDPFEEKLYYIKSGSFYSLALSNLIPVKLSKVFNLNARIFGHVRCYLPQINEYHYLTPEGYLAVIDCKSGNTKCKIYSRQENAFNPNILTDEIYSVILGSIFVSSDCYRTKRLLTKIPDYKGIVNAQMAVVDHIHGNYIVPYWAQNDSYKYAVIDIKNGALKKTIEQFCKPAIMDLQMMYDKPEALVRIVGDTIFVNKGKLYHWYLNDQLICVTSNNFIIPNQNGRYKAKVDFKEYSAFTRELIIDNILPHAFEYSIFPTLANENIKLNFNTCQFDAIKIYDLQGRILLEQSFLQNHTEYQITIDVGFLTKGLYIVNVFHGTKNHTKKFIKM